MNNKPKILCIDDEEGILEAVRRTLRNRFEVKCCSDPAKGRAYLMDHPDTSIVISDFMMKAQNGVEFLKDSRRIVPNASRVLLSGQIELKSLEAAINGTAIHKFVMKPWDNDHFLLHMIEAYKQHKLLIERDKLKALSITDPVTHLTNHRFFQERIRLEWDKHLKNKDQLSLIMIDIDHFKRFNDRFGHPEGDKILSLVATHLKKNLPEQASLSRYGGEEFALILPSSSPEAAHKVAEILRIAISSENFQNYPLSVSLGVATSPKHADSVNELIISADQSLYQAKRRGRNQTVVGLGLDD